MTVGRSNSRTMGRMLAIGVVLSVSPTVRLFAQCPDGSPPPCRAAPRRVPSAPAPNSVAVLYFDNLSRDTADAYVADGLTEEIILRLGQIERLAVKSRNAVQRFRGRAAEDPAVLGRTLGVAHLVSGSVRRSGPRLRVTVELVRAAGGDRLWGDAFDRSESDLLAIEEDIARAVATGVAGRLLPAEWAALAMRPTRSAEAYDHFIRGNYYLGQRTARAVARSVEEYRGAVQLDPTFSRALARIAYSYALFLDWGWDYPGVPPESLLARGFAASDRALRLDSTDSDSWMARAYLLGQRNTKTLASVTEAFERAIALDPRNAEAHHQYGSILVSLGRDSAAAAAYLRALELEPERPITLLQLGGLRAMERRYDESLQWLDSALQVDPGFVYGYAARALHRLEAGQTMQARGDAEVAVRLGAGYPGQAALATVEAREGDIVRARTRIDSLLRGPVDSLHPDATEGLFLSWALVALNERERAIDLLERVRPRGWGLWYYLRLHGLDPLREHPRFQRLVEDARPIEASR